MWIDIPDGSWVIMAKAGFSAGSPTTLVCSIVGHGSSGDVTLDTTTLDAGTELRGLSLLATQTFSETTPLALDCTTSTGGTASVTDVQLVAVKVSSLDVTDAGGGFSSSVPGSRALEPGFPPIAPAVDHLRAAPSRSRKAGILAFPRPHRLAVQVAALSRP